MTSIIAHRGYSTRFLENSPAAWRGAVEAGADVIEADIRFTADFVPVWSHDADLLRLAGRSERLIDIAHADLAALRAQIPGLSPDFAELLDVVHASTALLFDVKDERPEALERLHELLAPLADREIVLGLHAKASVARMTALGHSRILGLIQTPDDGLAFVEEGAAIVRLCESDATPRRMEELARADVPVWITTGQGDTDRIVGDHEAASLRRLAAAGAAGFLVNDPVAARAALPETAAGAAR